MMVAPGDLGIGRMADGRRFFIPARAPEPGELCIGYRVKGGGYFAIPLLQLQENDPALGELTQSGRIAVPLVAGCRAGMNRVYYSATETSVTVWCPNPGTINPDGNIWWFIYGYNPTHGGYNDDEPLDEVLEYLPSSDYTKPLTATISGPGVYTLMNEVYLDCCDYYTELFFFGFVVLPLVKAATKMKVDADYHQLRPQVSYGTIIWEEVYGADPTDTTYIGLDNFHQAWTYQYIEHEIDNGLVSISNCYDLYFATGSTLHYRYLYANPTTDHLVYTGAGPLRGVCGDRSQRGVDPANYWWQRIVFFEEVDDATSIILYKGGALWGPYDAGTEIVAGLDNGADFLNFGGNILCWEEGARVKIARLDPFAIIYTGPIQTGASRPKTDGERVVWSADDGEGVQVWDAATGAVQTIGNYDAGDPDIDRGMIVWTDGTRLWLKNGDANPEVIHTGAGTINDPAISNGTVAWSEEDPMTGLFQVWYLRVALTYPQVAYAPPAAP